MKDLVENVVEVVVVKTNKELIAEAISKLSPEQLALIYPPMTRANSTEEQILGPIGKNAIQELTA